MNIFITKSKINFYINSHIKFIKNYNYKCVYATGENTHRKIVEIYDIETDDYICRFYYENFELAFYTEQEIRKQKLEKLKSL